MMTLGSIIFPGINYFGETNIIYGFPSGMPEWNGLAKKKKHHILHQQIVDTCKFPEMFFKVSYLWYRPITDKTPPVCSH